MGSVAMSCVRSRVVSKAAVTESVQGGRGVIDRKTSQQSPYLRCLVFDEGSLTPVRRLRSHSKDERAAGWHSSGSGRGCIRYRDPRACRKKALNE
jgi:hypothetical protein